MSENEDSKVLYISGGGGNNHLDATTTQPHMENNLENEMNSMHDDNVLENETESIDGGAHENIVDDDTFPKDNFDDEHTSLFGGAKKMFKEMTMNLPSRYQTRTMSQLEHVTYSK